MEIEKGVAPTGFQYISFIAKYQEKYTLVACDELLRCTVRAEDNHDAPYTHFAREQVKAILPFLQAFAETGTFEPSQDEEQSLEEQLATMQEAGIAMASNIVDQGKRINALEKQKEYFMCQCDRQVDRIADLEDLLEAWKKFGQSSCDAKSSDMLLAETDELLMMSIVEKEKH